ncbi:hypothetical protein CMQ_7343 [Grosmannia clavigera kw1407]|uniref:Uncharacterized protein n=1 Tax=Grosmannia clavigera (strain kw1407 / UAMH 11150) TaxID=655863 RepID=F0XP71_GROCL|nr:uncharacterized protein CMQ_7343 [Grosmannia clavigera kw1407]EFX00341.1 hypothetical protein CMQ_7343 [Grosmannia clavigera kw1407]
MFSVLTVFIAFGAVTGMSEGIQASQRRARREEHRSRKNNLIVHCPKSSAFASQLEGRSVVLSGGRLFVDTSDSPDPDAPFGHPFAGYFLPYPEARYAGLVSTITDEAPIMNWVFAERESYALCYGGRAASEGNLTGPWDCTRQDRRLTFGGWEGFMAVRIPPAEDGSGGGFWALYFDRDGDRMKSKLADWPSGTLAVEVTLARRELRTQRPQLTAEQLAELQKRMEAAEAAKAAERIAGGLEEKAQQEQMRLEGEREERERREQEQREREFEQEKREQERREQERENEKTEEKREEAKKDDVKKEDRSSRVGADGETDDDDFSSSVCSGHSSWRASSSAMSALDSESEA